MKKIIIIKTFIECFFNILKKLPIKTIKLIKELCRVFVKNLNEFLNKNKESEKEEISSNEVKETTNLKDNQKIEENKITENLENQEKETIYKINLENKFTEKENQIKELNQEKNLEEKNKKDFKDEFVVLKKDKETYEEPIVSEPEKGEQKDSKTHEEPTVLKPKKEDKEEIIVLKPKKEKINVESGITINEIKERKYLFTSINDNEKSFKEIFKEIEKIKENLFLPEKDQRIYLKRIDELDRDIKKLKRDVEERIEDEDIEEEEYNFEVSDAFIKVLESDYVRIIETSLKNIEYKKLDCYKKAFKVFEEFLLNLGFEKGNFLIKKVRSEDKNMVYFENIEIKTKNKLEGETVKEIVWQPYLMYYKNAEGKEEEKYIKGRLIFWRYSE